VKNRAGISLVRCGMGPPFYSLGILSMAHQTYGVVILHCCGHLGGQSQLTTLRRLLAYWLFWEVVHN
jgi:hypothetical protein